MTCKWDAEAARAKQDASLDQWAAGQGLPFPGPEEEKAYQKRAGLIRDAIQLKKSPERVPMVPMTTFAPIVLAGLTGKDAMYDPDANGRAYCEFAERFQPDAIGTPLLIPYGPSWEKLGYHQYKWPGYSLPEDTSYQFHEWELMKPEEYDDLINDPTDFFWRIFLPRTQTALEPLANLSYIYGAIEGPGYFEWLVSLGSPEVQEAFRVLMEAARENFQWFQTLMGYVIKSAASGFPGYSGGITIAPFDFIGDTLRGTTPMMMDMFRNPEKVRAACDRLVGPMVSWGVKAARTSGNPLVFIPLHKGADGFMSDAQFKDFYWPSLKAVIRGLAAQGAVPWLFVEGAYNQRLDSLAEIDDMRCVFLFDRTDMARAREVMGGKACIAGGFPVSQILTGTPDSVRDSVKDLMDQAKGDGGYIMSVGCALDQGRADTLQAFLEAGKEYGKY